MTQRSSLLQPVVLPCGIPVFFLAAFWWLRASGIPNEALTIAGRLVLVAGWQAFCHGWLA
jgi:hypothetical protein